MTTNQVNTNRECSPLDASKSEKKVNCILCEKGKKFTTMIMNIIKQIFSDESQVLHGSFLYYLGEVVTDSAFKKDSLQKNLHSIS